LLQLIGLILQLSGNPSPHTPPRSLLSLPSSPLVVALLQNAEQTPLVLVAFKKLIN
jgi:hypothetical protein